MDPFTDSRFAPDAVSSTEMDLDIKGEASATPDLAIKREASSGIDGNATMADIPDSEVDPRSSQPPPPPSMSQVDGSMDDAPPPPPPPKASGAARMANKKGTASLVKKTTSRKTAKGSRAGKGARGGAKAAVSSSRPAGSKKSSSLGAGSTASSPPPAATGSSDVEGASEDDEDESDHGPYCICRGPDDHRWMISCDVCEDWFHGECVGVDKTIGEALIVRYVCPGCTDEKGVNVTRYRKTCSLEGCCSAARIYEVSDAGIKGARRDAASYSVFCSDKHADEWWEQLVRSLPENGKLKAKEADLTREKFMGLLNVANVQQSVENEEPWYIGKRPFGKSQVPPWRSFPASFMLLLLLLLLAHRGNHHRFSDQNNSCTFGFLVDSRPHARAHIRRAVLPERLCCRPVCAGRGDCAQQEDAATPGPSQ